MKRYISKGMGVASSGLDEHTKRVDGSRPRMSVVVAPSGRTIEVPQPSQQMSAHGQTSGWQWQQRRWHGSGHVRCQLRHGLTSGFSGNMDEVMKRVPAAQESTTVQ